MKVKNFNTTFDTDLEAFSTQTFGVFINDLFSCFQ